MSAKVFALVVVAAALLAGSVAPASAEFFGCNEPRTKVSHSSSNYRGHFAQAPAPRQQRYTSQSSQSHRRMASQWR